MNKGKTVNKLAKGFLILFFVVVGMIEVGLLIRNINTNPALAEKINNIHPFNKYDVYEKINDFRVSKGLNALKWNPSMCNFTHIRLNEIHSDWSHSHVGDFRNHINAVYFGENLSRGFSDSQKVVDAWIASPEHYKNIVEPHYTDTCIESDVATSTQDHELTMWGVQHFASF